MIEIKISKNAIYADNIEGSPVSTRAFYIYIENGDYIEDGLHYFLKN